MNRTLTLWIFCGFALVGVFHLLTAHPQHLFEALPYVLLMACPLMHVFGHRHGHGHDEASKEKRSP